MKSLFSRKSPSEITFDILNTIFMTVICFITIYPIWYTIVNSFNDGIDGMMGGIFWWPRKFTIENYTYVFSDSTIIKAFGISAARTIVGTVACVFFTAMVSYGLSKTDLIGRKIYLAIGTVTLFFTGGLIPTFVLIKNLGLYDNFLVYVIPTLFYFYNALIFMAFFRELPVSLEESAMLDGANDFTIFVRIILPLSKPVVATIALFAGVYHWNDYFMGIIYIINNNLLPIQTHLYKLVAQSTASLMTMSAPAGISTSSFTSQSIQLATMFVTTFPVVCAYPFLQKYFVKGMLLGAVKG